MIYLVTFYDGVLLELRKLGWNRNWIFIRLKKKEILILEMKIQDLSQKNEP